LRSSLNSFWTLLKNILYFILGAFLINKGVRPCPFINIVSSKPPLAANAKSRYFLFPGKTADSVRMKLKILGYFF
jgi:hypothetical protein